MVWTQALEDYYQAYLTDERKHVGNLLSLKYLDERLYDV